MRIKKGDTVVVITGKDKGKTGEVLKAMPKENRVIVEGVNIQTKHQKQTRTAKAEIKHVITRDNEHIIIKRELFYRKLNIAHSSESCFICARSVINDRHFLFFSFCPFFKMMRKLVI